MYNLECAKTPGFISMMRTSGSGNEKQDLDYENFRHITFKWHFKLTKSFVLLLESKDFIQVCCHGNLLCTVESFGCVPFMSGIAIIFVHQIAFEMEHVSLMIFTKIDKVQLYRIWSIHNVLSSPSPLCVCVCVSWSSLPGTEWAVCADKDGALLPQGVPPEHCTGEEDREGH